MPNHIKSWLQNSSERSEIDLTAAEFSAQNPLSSYYLCYLLCFLSARTASLYVSYNYMYFLFWNIFSFLVVLCHSFLPCSQMFFPFFVFSQMSYIYLSISCVIASQIHFEQNKTVLFMWQFSLHGYTRKSYNELIESIWCTPNEISSSKFTIIIYNHQQLAPFTYVILSHFT